MKKTIKLFLCCTASLLALNSCEKDELPSKGNSHSFNLTSNYTKTKYAIKVLYPENYLPSKRYRSIYLLDGDDYFKEAGDAIIASAKEDIVLVGVGYAGKNKRGTDYSYPKDNDFPKDSGGAKTFLKFINLELIPHVEGELDILSTDRTLFGHSLGGYFVLYTLLQQEQTNVFNTMIAASSNLMWGNAYLFDLEQHYFMSDTLPDCNLYMTVGDLEGASINLFFNAFVKKLQERDYPSLNLFYDRLKNTSHRNSPIQTFENALAILF